MKTVRAQKFPKYLQQHRLQKMLSHWYTLLDLSLVIQLLMFFNHMLEDKYNYWVNLGIFLGKDYYNLMKNILL
ncbi:unnamed protein product [Blepharisma stoltei]|uniref:Uncharacterized protein n=1 Tax=Blepharisma stoltei TaxID=1481888 RepID=A0AAU9K8E0_9CILI|nr:unnamed protein product [Blepharisma stoltei]